MKHDKVTPLLYGLKAADRIFHFMLWANKCIFSTFPKYFSSNLFRQNVVQKIAHKFFSF